MSQSNIDLGVIHDINLTMGVICSIVGGLNGGGVRRAKLIPRRHGDIIPVVA